MLYGIIAALVAALAAVVLRGQGLQGLLNNLKGLKIDLDLNKESLIKQATIAINEQQQKLNEEKRQEELKEAQKANEQAALDFWKKQPWSY